MEVILGFGSVGGDLNGEGDSWSRPNDIKCQTIGCAFVLTETVHAVAS